MSVSTPTRFPPTTIDAIDGLSDLRRDFAAWLRRGGAGPDRVEELSVVLSELVANAIRETPAGAPPTTVDATAGAPGSMHLEVSNTVDPDFDISKDWDLTDPLRTGGRGLLLVSALVDHVDVDVDGDRLVLRCTASF